MENYHVCKKDENKIYEDLNRYKDLCHSMFVLYDRRFLKCYSILLLF